MGARQIATSMPMIAPPPSGSAKTSADHAAAAAAGKTVPRAAGAMTRVRSILGAGDPLAKPKTKPKSLLGGSY